MSMPELRIGAHTARLPIMQGGMGVGVSLSGLASAVGNEGGIGEISAVGIGRDVVSNALTRVKDNYKGLRAEIAKARANTNGLISVNVMLALTDSNDLMRAALEEDVDIISLSAGLPIRRSQVLADCINNHPSTAFLLKVSSHRAVELVFKYWLRHYDALPEGVIIEGPLAGGHLGFTRKVLLQSPPALEDLVSNSLDVIRKYEDIVGSSIPLIAAGGIFTGGDIHRFLSLGASGVLMATRFVTTHECDAHINFKELYVQCREKDVTIIDSPLGLPGRAIESSFLQQVRGGTRMPLSCKWQCLKGCDVKNAPYCIARALLNARDGNLTAGFAFAGQNAWRCDDIYSVKEVFEQLKEEYARAVESEAAENHD